METAYKPVVAKDEFIGHSYDEFLIIQGLRQSVKEFAQILKGEKKGTDARTFFTNLAKEAEEMENGEQ